MTNPIIRFRGDVKDKDDLAMRVYGSFWLRWLLVLTLGGLGLLILALAGLGSAAAQGPTVTPLAINIPTRTATVPRQVTMTPSWTPQPNAPSPGRVEAKDKTTGANIRASPSTDAEILGKIFPGQFFAIIGRSNQWLKIQFDKSPTGVAWVYEGVVNITGISPSAIPTIDPGGVPTINAATGAAQQTAAYLTQTPGAPGTATALQASATGVITKASDGQMPEAARTEPLPTFTFPPPLVEATLPGRTTSPVNQGGVPPIVPIILLGGVGALGLLISALRRL